MTQPPLVLHVIHHLLIGGMENGLVNIINHMPSDRYRHVILCVEDYSDFIQRITRDDVQVIPLYRSKIGVWAMRKKIYQLCRELKPSIVHSRNTSGLDALLPAKLAGVKYCIHGEHGFDVNNLDGQDKKTIWLRRLHAPLTNHYITVSKKIERYMIETISLNPNRITQIYNGVNTQTFYPAPTKPSRDWLPQSLVQEDTFLVGTVGRAQPIKDQATLLRATAQVLSQNPHLALGLVIVGDGPLLPQLKSLADQLQISANVYFPGALNNIPQVLQSLDIFVLPSLNEGISNTILEAMATGLPVIASQVGGNVELVQDQVNGCLFPSGDVNALAAHILNYAINNEHLVQHGKEALNTANKRYSLAAMINHYQRVYDHALSNEITRSE